MIKLQSNLQLRKKNVERIGQFGRDKSNQLIVIEDEREDCFATDYGSAVTA